MSDVAAIDPTDARPTSAEPSRRPPRGMLPDRAAGCGGPASGWSLVVIVVGIAIIGPLVRAARRDRVRRHAEHRATSRARCSAPTTSARTSWSRFLLRRPPILVLAVARRRRSALVVGVIDRPRRRLQPRPSRRRADAVDGHHPRLPAVCCSPSSRITTIGPQVVGDRAPRRASRRCPASPASPGARRCRVVERDFVGAAEALGESRSRILAQRAAAERRRAAARRGQPAADLLDRHHRHARLPRLRHRRSTRPTGALMIKREPRRPVACSRGGRCCRSSPSPC